MAGTENMSESKPIESEKRGGSCAPAACSASGRKPTCYECGGDHEPSGARSDCIRHWKRRAIEAENKLQQIYGDALRRIRNYPIHSEPVGGAYAMQEVRLELYNAAVQYGRRPSHDYDSAMKIAQRLEDAADAFANRCCSANDQAH